MKVNYYEVFSCGVVIIVCFPQLCQKCTITISQNWNKKTQAPSEVWMLDAKKNLFTLEILEFYKYTSFSKFSYLTII